MKLDIRGGPFRVLLSSLNTTGFREVEGSLQQGPLMFEDPRYVEGSKFYSPLK